VIGTVRSLHRYPVKSLQGESLARLAFDAQGAVGDRAWAVRDAQGKLGSGKNTRRFRRMEGLFDFFATSDPGGEEGGAPTVTFPDGRQFRAGSQGADAALSARYGEPLAFAREGGVPHRDAAPVHLLTTASLAALGEALGESPDPRRFRPNLVLEVEGQGFVESDWLGRSIRVGGSLVLRATEPTERCVMVGFPQPPPPSGEGPALRESPAVLKTLGALTRACFGIYLEVVSPGVARVGDSVVLG
jgi:uncharacterized protein YcbX